MFQIGQQIWKWEMHSTYVMYVASDIVQMES